MLPNNRFILLIVAAFIVGTSLLIVVQFYSGSSTHKLITGNEKLLSELTAINQLREVERDIFWFESKIRAAIATDDPSHVADMDGKVQEIKNYLRLLRSSNHDPAMLPYIDRLNAIVDEKIKNRQKLLTDYRTTGKMDELAYITNPGARNRSNEITFVTKQIYLSRQRQMVQLSDAIADNARKARIYGYVLLALIITSGAGLCWFIVNRIRQQQSLIIQLNSSEKRAREAASIKENFLANMSHEIRTPLNSILGFTNLLQRSEVKGKQLEFVRSIQSAGENLLAIVNDILDLSKIEAGMMRIVPKPFSVRGLFDSLKTLFTEKGKEKNLQIIYSIDQAIPDTLIGDATRLTQILVNLIGNAIKFTEKGSIEISVFSDGTTGQQIRLGVKVADSGIGIERQKLDQIFGRFTQAEEYITRNYGGSGLGLTIVHDLVVLQSGEISVNSEPGKGTTFTFIIPYLIAEEQITIPEKNHEAVLDTERYEEVRLLIVDDNVMNQSLMKHLLEQWELSFDTASSGLEAIALLKKVRYDLVLMDIQMPVMDGYTASTVIRKELGMDIPIIAMTAHAMPGEREKCLSFGMNEYLPKPINESDLIKMLDKFIKTQVDLTSENKKDNRQNGQIIDLAYMHEVSKGNKSYERTVTKHFLDLIPNDISRLSAASASKDYETISKIAHELKTTVSILGLLPRLQQDLDILEEIKENEEEIGRIVSRVIAICEQGLNEAHMLYKQLTE